MFRLPLLTVFPTSLRLAIEPNAASGTQSRPEKKKNKKRTQELRKWILPGPLPDPQLQFCF